MNAINPQTWVAIGRVTEIPRRGARIVKAPGGDIAVFRTGHDEVYALRDRCPHAHGPLSNGIVHDRRVTCPLHGMVFDLTTGQAAGPDTCQAETIGVRVVAGVIELANPSLIRRSEEEAVCG